MIHSFITYLPYILACTRLICSLMFALLFMSWKQTLISI